MENLGVVHMETWQGKKNTNICSLSACHFPEKTMRNYDTHTTALLGSTFRLPRQLGMATWPSPHRRSAKGGMAAASDLLRQGVNMSLSLHLPKRWGKDNTDEAHPQGTLKDQGRINACLWRSHWGCPRRPSSSPREDSMFSEPWKCWLPVTAAWLWTRIHHSLGGNWNPFALMMTSAEGISKVFDTKMLHAEGLLKDCSWKSRG